MPGPAVTETGSMLDQLLASGAISVVDVNVAETVGRLHAEEDPEVLLAVALASRAPRYGHVCVELDQVADRIVYEERRPEAEVVPSSMTWPDVSSWVAAIAESPAVRAPEEERVAPLVLDGRRLYLDRYWRYQRRLETQLVELATSDRDDVEPGAVTDWLDRVFGDDDGQLDRQRLAAAVTAVRNLTVISGGPGTGKTTTIVRILSVLLGIARDAGGDPPRIALAAPTGKAAARMQEAIRQSIPELPVDADLQGKLEEVTARTLHRLLGWRRDNSTRFRHGADDPLPYDVVVVDEASMVSLSLMSKVIDALPRGARLVLVGDRAQLASVEAGAVLGDICAGVGAAGSQRLRLSRAVLDRLSEAYGRDLSSVVDVADDVGIWDSIVQLEHFYRFGPDTGIGAVARSIQRIGISADETIAYLRGERTEEPSVDPYTDVRLIEPTGNAVPVDVREQVVDGYRPFVEAALSGADPLDVLAALDAHRVLSPLRRGPQGVQLLNLAIAGWLGDAVEGFAPRGSWYLGRPVMVTQNDYGVRLFNGDVGVVVRHPDEPGERTVAFPTVDGGVRFVGPARLPPHETVFAMTVHKSQGSQFGRVFLMLPTVDSPILTRELIYTGITRAEKEVTVVAPKEILREALLRRVQRASGLHEKLWRT